ncbi:hypothetical protein Tco_1255021 [Tanacetum coccineum]
MSSTILSSGDSGNYYGDAGIPMVIVRYGLDLYYLWNEDGDCTIASVNLAEYLGDRVGCIRTASVGYAGGVVDYGEVTLVSEVSKDSDSSSLFGANDLLEVCGVLLLLVFACSRFGVLVTSVIEMDNATKDEDPKCWPACCRITRRENVVEGVEDLREGVNVGVGGAPDFSTIIAQQLQNLLPAILAVGWLTHDDFIELARLVPHLVTPESRKVERYTYGLAPQIRRMVAATEPKTMQKVVQISGALGPMRLLGMDQLRRLRKEEMWEKPSKDKNGRAEEAMPRSDNIVTGIEPNELVSDMRLKLASGAASRDG